MRNMMIAVGASLVLAATLGAADAKKPGTETGAAPSTSTGTTPPGFNQGNKTWRASTPPGWAKTHGKKRGWNGQAVPPGQYKKQTTPATSR